MKKLEKKLKKFNLKVDKLEKADFYPTIFKRKSIRNFDLTPLDDDVLTEVSERLKNLKPLYNNIKVELNIIKSDGVKTRMMKKAPYYIAVFSEAKEGYLTNIGYMLQQMDLFLSYNDLGSCWQGIPRPKKEVLNSSDLEFVIFIAFGKPEDPESLYRTDLSQFNRKSLRAITDITGADELLEAARIAPSATNSQPWFFTGNEKLIHAYSVKPGFIKSLMTKKYISIDLGIVIYHLQVAAEHFGKKAKFVFDENAEANALQGRKYIGSLSLD